MGPAERRDAYLSIAREALARGKVELARFAAVGAARLAEGEEADRRRAKLYEAAALVAAADDEAAMATLQAIDEARLAEEDWPCSKPLGRWRRGCPSDAAGRGGRPQARSMAAAFKVADTAAQRIARADELIEAEQMTMSHVAARRPVPADNAVARARDAAVPKGRPDEMGDADFGKHIADFAAGREPADRVAPAAKRDLEPRATRWRPLKDAGPQVSLPDELPAADVEMLAEADPLLAEKPSDAAAPPLSFDTSGLAA